VGYWFLKRDVVVEAWLKLSFDLVLSPGTKQSAVALSSTNNLDSLLFQFSLYLGLSMYILYLSLYGFHTPPIRIATIGRILKILPAFNAPSVLSPARHNLAHLRL
jgi:hypothetical protein